MTPKMILNERFDKNKLKKVIRCNNLDFEDEESGKIFINMLKKYNALDYKKNGVRITYEQSKGSGYGRFYAKNGLGLQGMKREVRDFISSEYVIDIDIKNCHPVLLDQLIKKNLKYPESKLDDYITNRDEFLTKNNTTKIKVLEYINTDTCNIDFFKDIHTEIYKGLVPKLKEDNEEIYKITKRKKKYNTNGAFLSSYLQNLENDILMVMYDYLIKNGYEVNTLIFDGLTINKKHEEEIDKLLVSIEKEVEEKLDFIIKLVVKESSNTWFPTFDKTIEDKPNENIIRYSGVKHMELYNACFKTNDDGVKVFCEISFNEMVLYMNNFLCVFNSPSSQGYRYNNKSDFNIVKKISTSTDRFQFGLSENNKKLSWLVDDNKLEYEKIVFCVDDSKFDENDYNLYKRPAMKECKPNITNSLFFDYIRNVICSNDDDKYNYILNYIAKMVKVGKTNQMIVLVGGMGTGKSSFSNILAYIIGSKYRLKIDDISRLSNRFNSSFEKAIIVQFEEVASNASSYYLVQDLLKTLTTESEMLIEKKGVDSYMIENLCNPIIASNSYSPVRITKDNRRAFVCKVSNIRVNDSVYFKALIKDIEERIEELRYYFYNYNYTDDLNSIRPTTNEELSMMNGQKPIETVFIEERLVLNGEPKNECRNFQNVYDSYRLFCNNNTIKPKSQQKFSTILQDNGFDIIRARDGGNKQRFVQGFTDNVDDDVEYGFNDIDTDDSM